MRFHALDLQKQVLTMCRSIPGLRSCVCSSQLTRIALNGLFLEEGKAMSDQARQAVELLLKNRQSDNRKSYLVRGRRYEQLSANNICKRWAEQMNRWADDSILFDQTALNDLSVEMGLREISLPIDQIAEARDKILAKSGSALATIVAGHQD